jgi:hypothetical protein
MAGLAWVSVLCLLAALVLSRGFIGVCSHEPLSVLSVATRLLRLVLSSADPGCLCMSLYQFSLFSALRLLQRWFFGLTWESALMN